MSFIDALSYLWVVFVLGLVLGSTCAGCSPRLAGTSDELAAVAMTANTWREAGLRIPSDCGIERLDVEHPDAFMFTQMCKANVNGCLVAWTIWVSPGHPQPLRLVVHETLHALSLCAYEDADYKHTRTVVWESDGTRPKNTNSIEARAKSQL